MPQISYSNNGNFLRTAIPQRELAQQMSSGTPEENGDHANDNLRDSSDFEKEGLQERQRLRRNLLITKTLAGMNIRGPRAGGIIDAPLPNLGGGVPILEGGLIEEDREEFKEGLSNYEGNTEAMDKTAKDSSSDQPIDEESSRSVRQKRQFTYIADRIPIIKPSSEPTVINLPNSYQFAFRSTTVPQERIDQSGSRPNPSSESSEQSEQRARALAQQREALAQQREALARQMETAAQQSKVFEQKIAGLAQQIGRLGQQREAEVQQQREALEQQREAEARQQREELTRQAQQLEEALKANQRQQHAEELQGWEQMWISQKENVFLANKVHVREVATREGVTASSEWLQWERDWQQEEEAWKSLVKAEGENLLKEFHKRDWELGFWNLSSLTPDAISVENQWRQARQEEVHRKLVSLQTQKAQSLQDTFNQLLTRARTKSAQIRAFEESWQRGIGTITLANAAQLRENISRAGLTASPQWPEWERRWQEEEQALR